MIRRGDRNSSFGKGLGLKFPGIGNVVRFVGERGAGCEGEFFVGFANLADDVMPAVVPADAGFVADHGPNAMTGAEGPAGLAVGFELDEESSATPVANFPFAEEIIRPDGCRHLPP